MYIKIVGNKETKHETLTQKNRKCMEYICDVHNFLLIPTKSLNISIDI